MFISKKINYTIISLLVCLYVSIFLGCQTSKQSIEHNRSQRPLTKQLPQNQQQNKVTETVSITKQSSIKIKQKWPLERTIIRNALIEMLDDWGEPAFEVDEILVRHVCYFFKYYSVKDYQRSNRAIKRSHKYLPYIIDVFNKHRLPEEIAFALPFVESSFNAKARSGVGAAGMFQFMKATARQYGLKVTRQKDERLNVYKAAPACAKYLRNNRNVFASSVLSLGSYHHGTGKVSQILLTAANADERKFGPIFNHKRLGKYSKEYIPQCLSAALIYRFMKSLRIDFLPEMTFQSKTISKVVSASILQKKLPDLYEMNPDLIAGKHTYSYASTNGYVVLSHINIGKFLLSKRSVKLSKKIAKNQPALRKKTSYKWPKNPSVKAKGKKISGRSKYIRYVFQEGNHLKILASIFGSSVYKLKNSKENRYLKKRSPRPGDIIRIGGLSPTTQKIGGGGYVCGRQMELKTRKGENLHKLCRRIQQMIQRNCQNTQWQMGADITPELIYYWNSDALEDITPKTYLTNNTPLVVYTDYLWHKEKKPKYSKKIKRKVPAKQKRRKGEKFISYIVQDQNIHDGKLIQTLANIFHVSPNELINWNKKLKQIKRNPKSWIGKQHKLFIKQCPESTQKFGNPGSVCGKTEDTRLLIKVYERLSDVIVKAQKRIKSCGGQGKGINEYNILYWNADILQKIGITSKGDRATKSAKLTIYCDFY